MKRIPPFTPSARMYTFYKPRKSERCGYSARYWFHSALVDNCSCIIDIHYTHVAKKHLSFAFMDLMYADYAGAIISEALKNQ